MTVAVIRDLLGQNDEWSLLLLYYVSLPIGSILTFSLS